MPAFSANAEGSVRLMQISKMWGVYDALRWWISVQCVFDTANFDTGIHRYWALNHASVVQIFSNKFTHGTKEAKYTKWIVNTTQTQFKGISEATPPKIYGRALPRQPVSKEISASFFIVSHWKSQRCVRKRIFFRRPHRSVSHDELFAEFDKKVHCIRIVDCTFKKKLKGTKL